VFLNNECGAPNGYFLWILDSVVPRYVIIVKHALARIWKAEILHILEIENTDFGITSCAADIPTDADVPSC
jgi:hypothetical protein